MGLRTLLGLVVAVLVLGALAWWQAGREQLEKVQADGELLAGFDPSRVRALRVDNLEQSLQLRIERDADGAWQIVDPVVFPAEPAVLAVLLDALSTQRLTATPAVELKKLSLDPPRMVLEVEELIGGELRSRRIEIGAVDLDGQRAFVLAEGRLGRTQRALDTTLDRPLSEWRSHTVLAFAPRDIVEVHRSGAMRWLGSEEPIDMTFDAALDGAWRATAPFQAQLDPGAMGAFLGALATLRVHSFVDAPGPLASYGLDRPALRIELLEAGGRRHALSLQHEPTGELWYASCEGAPHVYRVGPEMVMMIAPPGEGLLDRDLVRARRADITRVLLSSGGVATTLTRRDRRWVLDATRDGAVTISADSADEQKVDDLLGLLERTRFSQLAIERELRDEELDGFVRVESAGEVQGGVLGPVWRSADGAEGVLFRRDGDRLTAVLDLRVREAARADPQVWRSLELHKLAELEVARIELALAGVERVYVRTDKGRWSRRDSTAEAKEFAKLVDGLLSMRATELLKRGFEDQLTAPLEVRIARYSGDLVVFTLADWTDPASGASSAVYRSGGRFARVKPELVTRLRELLGQP